MAERNAEIVKVSAAYLSSVVERAIKFFGGECDIWFPDRNVDIPHFVCLKGQVNIGPLVVEVSVNGEDHCQIIPKGAEVWAEQGRLIFSGYLYLNGDQGLDPDTLGAETFRRWVVNKTLDQLNIYRERM